MSDELNLELHQFHTFVGQKLAANAPALSPEEALDEWRAAHRSPQHISEDLAAVQEALDDMADGDVGIPLAQFDEEFRRRHGIPATS